MGGDEKGKTDWGGKTKHHCFGTWLNRCRLEKPCTYIDSITGGTG